MKKLIVLILAMTLCLSAAACGGTKTPADTTVPETETPAVEPVESIEPSAAPVEETYVPDAADAVDIYITVACEGSLVTGAEELKVSDLDGDGAVTVNDALIAAHDELFEGGADAGYGTEDGSYGLAITKLWGVENGGAYGYYVNNVAAFTLTDPISEGDWVYAFAYADATGYSDAFTFFEDRAVTVGAGEELTLCLCKAAFDTDWNPITLAVEGAQLTVDGEAVESVTDADGNVTVTFDKPGEYAVSAQVTEGIIVPPLCVVTVD